MITMAIVFIAFAFAGLFIGVLVGDRITQLKLDALRQVYELKLKELEIRMLVLENVLEKLNVKSTIE